VQALFLFSSASFVCCSLFGNSQNFDDSAFFPFPTQEWIST